jgi:predicted transcriptional regulator
MNAQFSKVTKVTHHTENFIIPCIMCGKHYKHFNVHMYVHNGPVHVSSFICTCIMCGKHYKHFNVHMYVHNGPVHVSGFITLKCL